MGQMIEKFFKLTCWLALILVCILMGAGDLVRELWKCVVLAWTAWWWFRAVVIFVGASIIAAGMVIFLLIVGEEEKKRSEE